MVDRKKLSNICIYLGIFLLLVTIIGSFIIMRNVLSLFVKSVSDETALWGNIDNQLAKSSPERELISGMFQNNLVTQGLVVKTTEYLFGVGALILIVLSALLILQGLSLKNKN